MKNKLSLNSNLILFSGILWILTISPMLASSNNEMIILDIPEKIIVKDKTITLKTISKMSGANQDLNEKLENIMLAILNRPGQTVEIRKDNITRRINKSGIENKQVVLKCPEKVTVQRSGIRISEEKIEEIVEKFIIKKVGNETQNIKINHLGKKHEVWLPEGRLTYEVIPPRNSEYIGNTPISVEFYVNGKIEKQIWCQVYIELIGNVIVANKQIGKYQVITEKDIHIEKRNLAEMTASVIKDQKIIVGKRAKRFINKNEIIFPEMIEIMPIIKRGDVVTIVAESESLIVTTLGVAQEKGAVGDRIRLENIVSRKEIYARIRDSKTVFVDF